MPTLFLHTDEASGFTTVGAALSAAQYDSTMIQLKAEIDAVVATLDGIGSHVQNTDSFLDQGGSNQVAASEIATLLDDIPAVGSGQEFDTLQINSGTSAYKIAKNSFIYAYMENNGTATIISAGDTLTNILGTLSVVESNLMSSAGGTAIQNDSGETQKFLLTVQCSVLMAGASDDIELYMDVDAAVQVGFCTNYSGGGTNEFVLVWTGIVELPNLGNLQPQVKNVAGTVNLTVTQMQVTMKSIT